jgi:hypothetical protein
MVAMIPTLAKAETAKESRATILTFGEEQS